MKVTRIAVFGLIFCLAIMLSGVPVWADRGRQQHDRGRDWRSSPAREYVLDQRHLHNRYYPRPGHTVSRLPQGAIAFDYHRSRYYYSSGIWYRPSRLHFSVALPPVGLVVPMLPHAYTTVWVGTVPYYYAAGVYYTWSPRYQGYLVSELPAETRVAEEPELADQLFVYPKGGQSAEQQSLDRYQCHQWAVGETAFDPTRPGGNVPAAQNAEKRVDYARATKACLEARNYSVQ
ncbi:MAG: DUF6515 family protein [Desulfuromonadales bacterium]|nr:DUF6515 family protein [Desulfuromonadales bacterium]